MLDFLDGVENAGACATCGCKVYLPRELYLAAKKSAAISFFCGYGHSMHIPQGDSETTKLRRERDLLKQRLAEKDDRIAQKNKDIESLDRRRAAAVGMVTKIKNRVGRGVCPCCNRTFSNLQAHMKSKHSDFACAEVG